MKNNTKKFNIPYGKTVHGKEEIEAVVEVLRTSTQMGRNVLAMEEWVASLFYKKYGVMVNSGSSANYLSVEILKIPAGSEVITPVLTFSTTVSPLVKNNLIPAFVDVELNTFNINVNQIEEMISPKTKAMMIPNLLGNLPDWKKLRELGDKYNLYLIEDSADTIGATINDISSGFYSDISTTSFYGSHIINCAGNGGMLCVNSEELSSRAKLLRSWGRASSLFVESEKIENRFNTKIDGIDYDAKFLFETLGYNFEPSEMGAAFGLVQLKKLQDNILKRQENFKKHCNYFQQYQEFFELPRQLHLSKTAWLAFPLLIKDQAPFKRKELQIFLEKKGIQTRTIFTGNILRQPGFKNIPRKETKDGYINADKVMRGGLLLASHHGLEPGMIEYIHNSIEEFIHYYSFVNV